jgi:tartrate dehydratase alpha subunit/fumarate hydratase class I-like protein
MTIAEEIQSRQRMINLIDTQYDINPNPAYLELKEVCKKQIEMLFDMINKNTCPLCHDTGFYSFGGSFGGAVQTVRCDCKINKNDEKL